MARFAGKHPRYLQEALDHAARLVDMLGTMEPSSGRRSAAIWLIGRSEEVDCVARTVLLDWKAGRVGGSEAARSIQAYIAGLHRGLAVHFGELAPSCCLYSLIVTASPSSYGAPTSSFPPRPAGSRSLASTWGEIDDADLVEVLPCPSLAVTRRPSSTG